MFKILAALVFSLSMATSAFASDNTITVTVNKTANSASSMAIRPNLHLFMNRYSCNDLVGQQTRFFVISGNDPNSFFKGFPTNFKSERVSFINFAGSTFSGYYLDPGYYYMIPNTWNFAWQSFNGFVYLIPASSFFGVQQFVQPNPLYFMTDNLDYNGGPACGLHANINYVTI